MAHGTSPAGAALSFTAGASSAGTPTESSPASAGGAALAVGGVLVVLGLVVGVITVLLALPAGVFAVAAGPVVLGVALGGRGLAVRAAARQHPGGG